MRIDLSAQDRHRYRLHRRHRLCHRQGIGRSRSDCRGERPQCRRCREGRRRTDKRRARREIRGVAADVGSAQGCTVLATAEPSTDILVNNVGIYGPEDFFETSDDQWQHFFDVNVMSGVRLSRAYLPGMQERNWGRVVFISSDSGLNIPADMIHYGFTRTANLSVSRGLAKRVAGTGVTVNAVLPGPTLSEGVEDMLKDAAQKAGQSIAEAATAFEGASGQARSSSGWRPWTRSRTWSCMSVRRWLPQPRERRCASMAALSTRSPDRSIHRGAIYERPDHLRSRPACRSRRRARSGSGNIPSRRPAFRASSMNSRSCHSGMPELGDAFSERRDRKNDVVMMSNFQPCLRQIASAFGMFGCSM